MIGTKPEREAKVRTLAPGLLLLALVAAGVLLTARPAQADTFRVNSMEDAGDNNPGNGTCATRPFPVGTEPNCTLRAAIQETNGNGESDTIIFDPALSGAITLTLGELHIANDTAADDLTIQGPGARKIAVSGNDATTVFVIGLSTNVTISGLTISNGITSTLGPGAGIINFGTLELISSTVSDNATDLGGGIYNEGSLELTNSTVSGNSASASGLGGGILNDGGVVRLTNSTVSRNTANSAGGGIYNADGTLTLSNSTVSGNTATDDSGGGIYNADGTLELTNSTVSGNTATVAGGGIANFSMLELSSTTVSGNTANSAGGGIFIDSFDLSTLRNTIVARNTATNGPDARGSFTSQGNNLIGDTTGAGGFSASDLLNVNPRLGPLRDNGGPTDTHALLKRSRAINAGGTPFPDTDQRGVTRPQGSASDIGAFEKEKKRRGR